MYQQPQQQGGYGGPYGGPPPQRYNQYDEYAQGNGGGGGYYRNIQQPPAQNPVEMTQFRQQQTPNANTFFDEVSSISESIREIQNNVSQIEELHARTLGTISDDSSTKNKLDNLLLSTRTIANDIKTRIKSIEAMNARLPPNTSDLNVRKAQAAALRKKFMETIQNYQQVEYQNRQKYRQRMERQYRIVKPNATQDEIEQVLDNDGGNQVFAQSLLQSSRYGEARAALAEVQQRHDDIKKIEKTIEELANLFQEMNLVVDQQDAEIEHIENEAIQVTNDMEAGVQHIGKALEHAKSARKKKWICFLIIIILLAIIAAVIYFFVIKK
jgi:syntaxin 1B/2/3